jgi:hypothetical protein
MAAVVDHLGGPPFKPRRRSIRFLLRTRYAGNPEPAIGSRPTASSAVGGPGER